tara:strand:- start:49 stop:204 length:156 start_codon:yes stop_codon:yes gene_type:complete
LPLPDGLVAQLVEQRIENPRVGGSIPPQATILLFQHASKHPKTQKYQGSTP